MIHTITNSTINTNEKCSKYKSVPQFNCIKIQPRWVQDMKEVVGDLQLHSLLIPGSHNAGAYNKFTSYSGDNVVGDAKTFEQNNFRRHGAFAL